MSNHATISKYVIMDRNGKVVYRDSDLGRTKTYLGRLQAPWEKKYHLQVEKQEVNIYDDGEYRRYCL